MSFHSLASWNQTSRRAAAHPTGMIAVGEVMVVLAAMISLFWLGSRIWSVVEGGSVQAEGGSRRLSERAVYRISLDDDGQRMWVYRPSEGVLHINLASGATEQSLPLSGTEVCTLAHSRNGTSSLLCGQDNSLLLYRNGEAVRMSHVAVMERELAIDAAVSADGNMAVCLSPGGQLRGWRRDGGETREFSYELPSDPVIVRMALSNSGRRMCVARIDGTVAFYNPDTGIREFDEIDFGSDVRALGWSRDDRSICAAGSAGQLRLYDAEMLICTWEIEPDDRSTGAFPTAMVLSPDGRWVAVGFNASKDIHVFATSKSEADRRLHGHKGIIRTLQFAPDSKSLYSGSYDGTIRQWSFETWAEVRMID